MEKNSMLKKGKFFLKSLLPQNICHSVKRQNYRDYYSIKAFQDVTCGVSEESRDKKITVSLTTYGKRIYDVYITIQSLFEQTCKADNIILWLAETEFDYESVPEILKRMERRGLEIRFCAEMRSYKKLLPVLKENPDDVIITVDDDMIYPFDMIENLYAEYLRNKGDIIFNYGNRITLSGKEKLAPYMGWEYVGSQNAASHRFFAIGVGGILYPPGSLHEDIFNYKLAEELAPYADDIWFKAMAMKRGTRYRHSRQPVDKPDTFLKKFITIEDIQEECLGQANVLEEKNDIQLKAVFEYFDLWDYLVG